MVSINVNCHKSIVFVSPSKSQKIFDLSFGFAFGTVTVSQLDSDSPTPTILCARNKYEFCEISDLFPQYDFFALHSQDFPVFTVIGMTELVTVPYISLICNVSSSNCGRVKCEV